MNLPTIVIEPAHRRDVPAMAALLRDAGLAHEDFPPHLGHFLVARDGQGRIVGTIGAELQTPEALLRSLAVAPAHRGAGLGRALLGALETAAAEWGVERWWLLTTTAGTFFAHQGFVEAPRLRVPAAILGTGQFSGGCPCSAVCFTRERRRDG